MAKVEGRALIETTITLAMSKAEASALYEIAGYGADSFLKVFYKELGEVYLKPHEAGLRSLFHALRGDSGVQTFLNRARDAELIMRGQAKAIPFEEEANRRG